MSEKTPGLNRVEQAAQLVQDLDLHSDAEFFSDPSNRLEFLAALNYEDFLSITQHVNARVRGFEPRDKRTIGEGGASLPMLATPSVEEKPEALRAGFDVIQEYLRESTDDNENKIKSTGMAIEALIIWVHPFNDGNGRTSRFLGKFIEDGTMDTDQLIEETASNNTRQRFYDSSLRVDQSNTNKGLDLLLSDDEIEELKKTEMPVAEGISLSIKRLLEDKRYQDKVYARAARYLERREKYKQRQATAAA